MVLKGKVAIVTGGARGIGKVIARKFAEEGAHLVIVDVNKEIDKTAELIKSFGAQVLSFMADISRSDQVKKIMEKTLENFGSVDILVNNAGVLYQAPLMEIKEKEWDKVMEVNLKGTFLCTQAVARDMIPKRSGKIINISSVSAIIPGSGMAAYCTSKAAILQFTRVVALELAPHKICVNAVCPGTTETKMVTDLLGSEVMENWRKKIPMGRFPRAGDHASLIAFLASSAGDCITGQFISVDCGQLLNFAQP
ncbi:3-oxoacyl-[acyl-carrier-protein] reductase FabG [subsurface metagenome]